MPRTASTCPADGAPDSSLFVLAEAPGDTELFEGRPLVGAMGRVLWGALKRGGVFRHQCRISHVFNGVPELKNGQPSAKQIAADWDRLDEELAASQARVVVLVGGVALKRVTGIAKGIQSMRGYVLRPQDCQPVTRRRLIQVGEYATTRKGHYTKGDPKFAYRRVLVPPVLPPNCEYLLPILNPETVRKMGFRSAPALFADCERVGRVVRGELDLIDKVPYEDHAGPVAGTVVAWDIETDGETITRLGVTGDKLATWSSPITPWVARYVWESLTDGDQSIICHNAAFDIPRLARMVGLGLDEIQATIEDTMLTAQLLCPDLPKGLEKASTLYLDLTPWKDSAHDDLPAYNAKDVYVTRRLRDEQLRMVEELQMTPVMERVRRVMRPLWKATARGIRINRDFAVTWVPELEEEMTRVVETWPYPEFPLSLPRKLIELLYFKLKCPPQYGKKGALSTAEEALEEIRVIRPELSGTIDHILDFRRVRGDLKVWGPVPDRVHPSFLPAVKEERGVGQGASTGRIQSRDPNIMALPKRARALIIPDEGKILGYVDLAQAEAWVEAVTFQDQALIKALGEDLHAFISQKHGIDRTRAKNFWYGSGRGAGPRKLRKVMVANGYPDMTESECRAFQAALKQMFPDWAKGREALTARVKASRLCRNPMGRLRIYYAEPGLPDVVGWFIQSTVADAFLELIAQVDQHVELLTPYHDAVLFQTDEPSQAEKVLEVFQQPFPQIAEDFHFSADLATTTGSWGEME